MFGEHVRRGFLYFISLRNEYRDVRNIPVPQGRVIFSENFDTDDLYGQHIIVCVLYLTIIDYVDLRGIGSSTTNNNNIL